MRKLLFFVPRFITLFRVLEPIEDSPNCFVAVRVRKEHLVMPKVTIAYMNVFTFLGYTKILRSFVSEIDSSDLKRKS